VKISFYNLYLNKQHIGYITMSMLHIPHFEYFIINTGQSLKHNA